MSPNELEQLLIDRYTVGELVDLIGLTMETFLTIYDVYPDRDLIYEDIGMSDEVSGEQEGEPYSDGPLGLLPRGNSLSSLDL